MDGQVHRRARRHQPLQEAGGQGAGPAAQVQRADQAVSDAHVSAAYLHLDRLLLVELGGGAAEGCDHQEHAKLAASQRVHGQPRPCQQAAQVVDTGELAHGVEAPVEDAVAGLKVGEQSLKGLAGGPGLRGKVLRLCLLEVLSQAFQARRVLSDEQLRREVEGVERPQRVLPGHRKVVRERPGLVPSALFHLIGNTVFLRLSDVAAGLPPYEEQVMLSSMDSEEDATGYSQRSAYNHVFEELRKELAEALKKGSKRLLATYLQTLLAYPDGCTRGETVFDPRSGDVIVQVPPLSEGKLYPKEQALLDLVAAERMEGRRVLVYVTHTGTRDVTERMDDFLTRHGFRVVVMKADAVAPDRREAWVADRVKQGVDVLVCTPGWCRRGWTWWTSRPSAGRKPSSLSSNQHKKVRFSWAVDLDATEVE